MTNSGSLFFGIIIGFIYKKFNKLVSIVLASQLILFAYLEYINLININYDKIYNQFDLYKSVIIELSIPTESSNVELITSVSFIGSFLLGIIIGYKYI